MEYILGLLAIYFVIDVYYRFRDCRKTMRFILLMNDVINNALVSKGILDREDIDLARKDVIGKMYIGDYRKIKKDLLKMGIDIDK